MPSRLRGGTSSGPGPGKVVTVIRPGLFLRERERTRRLGTRFFQSSEGSAAVFAKVLLFAYIISIAQRRFPPFTDHAIDIVLYFYLFRSSNGASIVWESFRVDTRDEWRRMEEHGSRPVDLMLP